MELFLDIINSRFAFVCAIVLIVIGADYIFNRITKKEQSIYKLVKESTGVMKVLILIAAVFGLLYCIPLKYLVVLNGNNYPITKMPGGEYCSYSRYIIGIVNLFLN